MHSGDARLTSAGRERLGGRIGTGAESGERVAVAPGHPLGRIRPELGAMALELAQVVERVDLVQLGGVNQAHEQIADRSPVLSLVEERVLAVQDGLLEGALAEIVIERCPVEVPEILSGVFRKVWPVRLVDE
jgi:hypothetical protein